jgi:hypothetical protein
VHADTGLSRARVHLRAHTHTRARAHAHTLAHTHTRTHARSPIGTQPPRITHAHTHTHREGLADLGVSGVAEPKLVVLARGVRSKPAASTQSSASAQSSSLALVRLLTSTASWRAVFRWEPSGGLRASS